VNILRKIQAVIVLSVSILAAVSAISFTFAGSERLIEPSISLAELRERLPDVEVKMEIISIKDPGVIEVYGSDTLKIYRFGGPPEFGSELERQKWFEKLGELANLLEGPDVPYWGDPVGGHGVGYDGYYCVDFAYNMSFTEDMMVEIFKAVNEAAKKIGFERLVPISFGRSGPIELNNRAAVYRPIIGGIQIQNRDLGVTITSTLSWSAVRSGVNGYVVSGHIGYNRPLPNGSTIYQPTYPNYPAGVVRAVPTSPYYADAAWVEYSNVAPKIYLTSSLIVSVNFYQEPSVNSTVYMSGIASELVNGVVRYVNRDTNNHPYFKPLYRQAYATYPSAGGDSGAPVYIPTQYGRGIVGVHIGREIINGESLAIFSQTSGVRDELGAVPLTTWP